ncbi:MAG: MMPL family transporter [Rhodospirillales bacterium]
MSGPGRAFLQDAFRTWVGLVRRGAWAVVILSILGAGLTVAYLARNLAINTDTTDMLSAELPFRQHNRAVNRLFPQLSDNLLVVLDGDVPELVDRAARQVTVRIKAQPNTFGALFDPEGDPFLQKNGLLFLSVAELEDLTGRLAEAQPFLASLWGDPSLATLFDLLRKGIEQQLAGKAPPVALAKVLDMLADIGERRLAGEDAILSWRRLLSGKDSGAAQRFIVLKPPLDFGSLQPAGKSIKALQQMRRELQLDGTGAVRMRVSGSVALQQDELKSVERGMGLAGIISFILVFGLLIAGLRSPQLVLAVLATLVLGLVWTAGFAIWALGTLNLISVAFAVLFIGLSVDFGIHFSLRYREHRAAGMDNGAALEATAAKGGGGLTLCAVAAAIAFYSFLPTDYVGLAELGLIAGSGMFIALAANLTVLPAMLSLMPAKPGHGEGAVWAAGARSALQNHPRRVLIGAAVAVIVGLMFAPQARFDFDPLNLKDRQMESVAVVHELAAGKGATTYSATVLADNVAAARELAETLTALPEVAGVASIHSFVPDNQDEKTEIVQDLALFMLPSLPGKPAMGDSAPERRRVAAQTLSRALDKVLSNEAGPELSNAAKRFSVVLAGMNDKALPGLEKGLLAVFPDAVTQLRDTMSPEPYALDDLPDTLLRRYVAQNGQARLDVLPQEDLRDPAAVAGFVAAVRSVAPDVSGAPVTIFEAGQAVLSAFIEAGAIAISAILILLGLLLRRWDDVLFVFMPLTLAAVLTVMCSVLFDVPFNFANIIVLPLLFGLGVASGIHLVLRDRQERLDAGGAAPGNAFETSTPRAVLFSALTTIGSFGAIALSGHPGTASMGGLLTIAIALTLMCTLVLLPALLALRGGRPGSGAGT